MLTEIQVDKVRDIQINFSNGRGLLMKLSKDGHMSIISQKVGTTLKVHHEDFAVGIQIVERK